MPAPIPTNRKPPRNLAPALIATAVLGGSLDGGTATAAALDRAKAAPASAPLALTLAPAPAQGPSPHEIATLAAATEANRIAKEGLAAQVEAARWQTRLGIWALVWSAITGVAAIAAALYARNAWRESRRSADLAERAMAGYERPFLLLEIVKSGITLGDRTITFDVTKYVFRNLGRVPALITRRHFELVDGADMPEPIDPTREAGKPVVHGVAVGANGVSQEHETGRALPLLSRLKPGAARRKRDADEPLSVYFHGFVEYRDLSGRTWITGFCFAHSDNEVGFQPLSLAERGGPDPYNYDRQVT